MNKQAIIRYNCFKAIRAFGQMHAEQFAPTSFAGTLFTQMADVVTRLDALGAEQTSSSGASLQGTASKEAATQRLEAMLDSIHRAAKGMEVTTPGISERFRRPRRGRDASVLNTARAYLSDATPLKAEFVKFGMSADFLEQLTSLIQEFEEAVKEQQEKSQTRVSATAAIREAIKAGLQVRRQLNPIVRNSMEHDPAVIAAWDSASHIEQTSVKKGRTSATSPKAETPGPADQTEATN